MATQIFTIIAKFYYYTYNLRGMIQNKDIVVVQCDKDSSLVITKNSDYVTNLDSMTDDGIMKGTYVKTTDNTLKELLWFQDFLYGNFYSSESY